MSRRTAVLVDFDGTASLTDVGGRLLERFARNDDWKVVDNDYLNGRVGSRHAYRLSEGLLECNPEAWLAFALETAHLDPGLAALVQLCRANSWTFEILSDGLDFYIYPILRRAGLNVPVQTNRLLPDSPRPRVFTPHMNPLCGRCGTCKSDRVREWKRRGWTVVYVGDGYSDLCAAPRADRIFAKDVLARHCEAQGVAFDPFESLEQVARALSSGTA